MSKKIVYDEWVKWANEGIWHFHRGIDGSFPIEKEYVADCGYIAYLAASERSKEIPISKICEGCFASVEVKAGKFRPQRSKNVKALPDQQAFQSRKCSRCGGSGYIKAYEWNRSGVCFSCNPDGKRLRSKDRVTETRAFQVHLKHVVEEQSRLSRQQRGAEKPKSVPTPVSNNGCVIIILGILYAVTSVWWIRPLLHLVYFAVINTK